MQKLYEARILSNWPGITLVSEDGNLLDERKTPNGKRQEIPRLLLTILADHGEQLVATFPDLFAAHQSFYILTEPIIEADKPAGPHVCSDDCPQKLTVQGSEPFV